MARAGAGGSVGRINGRFALLTIVCGILSAVLVYAAIARNGGTKQTASAETTAATVIAAVDIPARTQITAEMVEVRDVPVSGRMAMALSNVDDVVGKVTRYPVGLDEQFTSSKVVSVGGTENVDSLSFAVPKGMRAISISADQVLSAGGLVLPGDYVDIMGVLSGTKPDGSIVDNYVVKTILQNVQVLAVAQTIADAAAGGEDTASGGQSGRSSESKPNPEATTLTLLVTPTQAQTLFLAESNGTLRAVVRGFGDSETTELAPAYQNQLSPVAP
jgi:pilus assembly protein CpaB